MNDLVKEIIIFKDFDNSIFSNSKFMIPLYQRAYAWREKEIVQLIDDINDIDDLTSHYYIGTLVVSKKPTNDLEIIDGQQRLTTLFLILRYLGIKISNENLKFECREKSNKTLKYIGINFENDEDFEQSIYQGYKIIKNNLKSEKDKNNFLEKLKKAVIYQIEVPENTDLNHYFEVMNSRGEQLEEHDILKAKLISYLEHEDIPNIKKEMDVFASIWDASREMNGYLQMHLHSKNNKLRDSIFGNERNDLPKQDFDYYLGLDFGEVTHSRSFKDIINDTYKPSNYKQEVDDDTLVRFTSIINFPYLLLHTLKVFVEIEKLKNDGGTPFKLKELLDDKKLIDTFDEVIDKFYLNKKSEFSKKFIIYLLRTRFLFDKYIIKSEKSDKNTDGSWSLKEIKTYGQKGNKYADYVDTKLSNSNNENNLFLKTLMLEACLRVSYTSPKIMHRITKALIFLYKKEFKLFENNERNEETLFNHLNSYIKEEVWNNYLSNEENIKTMGLDTPHIVFNYLDFFIRGNNDIPYNKEFSFIFRNSVEHFYPRNPFESERSTNVDSFGNLALLPGDINSKFSNLKPEAKLTYKDAKNGSIKLRKMSKLIEDYKMNDEKWINEGYKKHEEEMIKLFKENFSKFYEDKKI